MSRSSAALLEVGRENALLSQLRRRMAWTTAIEYCRTSRLRLALVASLTAVFWFGLFTLFVEGFTFLRTAIGDDAMFFRTVEVILATFFASLMTMLAFSTGIILYSGLYDAPDSVLLLASPLRDERIVAFKLQEALLLSSWGFLLLSTPLLLAYGAVGDASAWYFVLGPAYLASFTVIPGALGAMLCLVVVFVAPHRRWAVLAGAGLAFVVAIAVVVRSIAGLGAEQVVAAKWLAGALTTLRFSEHELLPSWWLASGLMSAARADWSQAAAGGAATEAIMLLVVLIANALALSRIAAALGGRLYRESYSRLHSLTRRARRRREPLIDAIAARLLGWTSPGVRLLLVKDLKTFRRDPAQWSQFLIFFALLAMYFFNLPRFQASQQPALYVHAIAVLNLAVIGLMLAIFSTRFIFPLISMEGRCFWILSLAPINRGEVLWSKFMLAALGGAAPSMLLVVFSDLSLQMPASVVAVHLAAAALLSIGLAGVAVGLGAVLPDLRESSPSRIASGFGGNAESRGERCLYRRGVALRRRADSLLPSARRLADSRRGRLRRRLDRRRTCRRCDRYDRRGRCSAATGEPGVSRLGIVASFFRGLLESCRAPTRYNSPEAGSSRLPTPASDSPFSSSRADMPMRTTRRTPLVRSIAAWLAAGAWLVGGSAGLTAESLTNRFPEGAVAYVEVRGGERVASKLAESDAATALLESPQYQAYLESEPYRKFEAGRTLAERQLGIDLLALADCLTSGVAAAAVYPNGEEGDLLVVLRVADRATFRQLLERVEPLLILADEALGVSETLDGAIVIEIPDVGRVAWRDDELVFASTRSLMESANELRGGDDASSLAHDAQLAAAARGAGDRDAWAWVDAALLREAADGEGLPRKLDNPVGSLLFGGLTEVAARSDSIAVQFDWADGGVEALVEFDVDPSAVPSTHAAFYPRDGEAGVAALPDVAALAGGFTFYRDFAAWYRNREALMIDSVLPEFDKFEAGVANFMPGKAFSEDVLPLLGKRMTIVAAEQSFDHLDGAPGVKLPGFALLLELAEPEEAGDLLGMTFQTFTALLNISAGQEGRQPWVLRSESYRDVQIAFGKYYKKPTGDRLPIVFNFMPASARVNDHYVIATSVELCRELVDKLLDGAETAAAATEDLRLELHADAIAELLELNREHFVAELVKQGRTTDAAAAELDAAFSLVRRLDVVSLASQALPDRFAVQFQATWQ